MKELGSDYAPYGGRGPNAKGNANACPDNCRDAFQPYVCSV